MKKIILFIGVLTIIACKSETPVDYVLVNGKITNYPESKIYIGEKTVKVTEYGTFLDTIKLKKGEYKIQDPKNSINIYIENGFDLAINYDYNDFKNSLVLTGKGAEEYYYLIEKTKELTKIKEDKEIYKLSEEAYKAKIDEIKLGLDDKVNVLKNSSSKFKEAALRVNTYFYIRKLGVFQKMHKHYTESPDFKVSENFSKTITDAKFALNYENEYDFINSKDYKILVNSHYMNLAMERAKINSSSSKITFLKVLSEIENDVIKNQLAFESAKNNIKFVKNPKEYYKIFIELSTNENHKKRMTSIYEKQSVIAKGEPSPKFLNYENWSGDSSSLDDFRGKYVYIDVWATWCGPCKEEIPFLKEVEKKYHDKNIEFISISIDKLKDKNKWKRMVENLNLTGVQLLADNAFKSQFVQDYLITGIPRFILLDPKGNIITSTAPRPSRAALIELFDEVGI